MKAPSLSVTRSKVRSASRFSHRPRLPFAAWAAFTPSVLRRSRKVYAMPTSPDGRRDRAATVAAEIGVFKRSDSHVACRSFVTGVEAANRRSTGFPNTGRIVREGPKFGFRDRAHAPA